MKYIQLLIMCLVLVVSACSSRTEINLRSDGSGTAVVNLVLSDAFAAYITEMSEILGDGTSTAFDRMEFKQKFNDKYRNTRGLWITDISGSELGPTEVNVSFNDIQKLLPPDVSGKGSQIIFYETKQAGVFEFSLSRDGFFELLEMINSDQLYLSELLPSPDSPMTEDEYRDFLSYMLEDFVDDGTVKQMLDESRIETNFTIENGTIVKTTGEKTSDHTARLILDLVTTAAMQQTIGFGLYYAK